MKTIETKTMYTSFSPLVNVRNIYNLWLSVQAIKTVKNTE